MGVTEGESLVLNLTQIEDVISVTVNTVALFIFNYGVYAAALVGVVVLEYVT